MISKLSVTKRQTVKRMRLDENVFTVAEESTTGQPFELIMN